MNEEEIDPGFSVLEESGSVQEDGVTVNVTIQQPETSEEETPAEVEEEPTPFRTFSVVSIDLPEHLETAAATMADAAESVLGEYQRRTYTVQEMDMDGNVLAVSTEYVPGLAGLDYAWIAGAVLFGLFWTGFFKLLGGLLRS